MSKIRYISIFSGIEAWSCAVKNMPEYEPVAFCEIDPFASAEYNGKSAPDSLRYKCLGNSFSVNVVKWIAQRILDVEKEGENG